ncbi:MAG: hypothetical protein ABI277_12070 [Burkholderiaceae bacterium]
MTISRTACAQSTAPSPAFNGAADRTENVQFFDRLDAATIGLIVAAIVIIALLAWRVVVMIRSERPVVVPQRRRPHAESDDSPTRPSLQRSTDWGFDQNKRSAQVRAPVRVDNAETGLPSLESAVTQWSISNMYRAHAVDFVADDSLGKSPTRAASAYRTSFDPYLKREPPDRRTEVVEVADALLQAELLVRLGDPKRAMTLLSHHIRENEKPGAAAWLMLLNLYQSTGREAQYKALGDGFKLLFNAEVPPWATSSDVVARELESYPQVMMKLLTTWSGPLAKSTVASFLNDDRGGCRQGFSLTAYRELLFIAEILDTLDLIAQDAEDRDGIRRKLGPAS